MRSLRDLYAASQRLPVRLRIAIVSASLTAIILIVFALIVGRLVSDRLHADFTNELQANAAALANGSGMRVANGRINVLGLPSGTEIRIVLSDGQVLAQTAGARQFGPPRPGAVVSVGPYEVAATQYVGADLSQLLPAPTLAPEQPLFLQYARPEASVDETIGRLWLFLGGGVAVGTLLAGLAGMAVANRAMRPIAALTATASDIATTRDPSQRIPVPRSDDEVAELARTLDQMLRELDAARGEIEDTIQRQREFVADASHELRTPLTSILANLELLHDGLAAEAGRAGDDDERAAAASALRSSRRMNRLVGDLLLLARADAGRAGTRVECDLAGIAAEALDEVRPVADGHSFVADIDVDAPVEGNPDELHRMILNLLENAIRHTGEGTTVEVSLRRSGDQVELQVADDGPGLPPGMETQVFERFVRGSGPADRAPARGTGTGLGLSIVRAVTLAHRGRVRADGGSAGARFTVTLPLAGAAQAGPGPPPRAAPESD